MNARSLILLLLVTAVGASGRAVATPGAPVLERVTTAVPFPRGLAMVDGTLHVLCRGRVRGAGGVTATVEDQAGTLYAVDPAIAEPATDAPPTARVDANGTVVARPTAPPFRLWDRTADPPERDRDTDRPYCTLRWHAPTSSFYVCAFSGIDKRYTADDRIAFSKNRTDALLRYDLRTRRWHEVERHDPAAGASYPHHDPAAHAPPHGLLNGPDNCLPLGRWLYAVAKDNSVLARYDLAAIAVDPSAPAPPGEIVLGPDVDGLGPLRAEGHSALAARDGWLYVGCRTSSIVFRIALDATHAPVRPIRAELVARFDPFDRETFTSANITDMAFDDAGRLYVVSAQPARIFRFTPDPDRVYDARGDAATPWLDLAGRTGDPRTKSENILVHDGRLYVTTGDAYGDAVGGTVYRVAIDPSD